MQARQSVKRGSATAIVVLALVVIGIVVTLIQANNYNARKRAAAYQQQLIADRQAAAEKEAADAEAARIKAAEEAEKNAAEKAEAERKQAAAAAKQAAADKKAADAKFSATRFHNADQAFIEAPVEMWTKSENPTTDSTWCLLPQENGSGRVFEIFPDKEGKSVRLMGENGAVETMTEELFATRYLGDNVSWFSLRDGTALLHPSPHSVRLQEEYGEKRHPVPDKDASYNIAVEMYGDAVKTMKVYKMKPPKIAWSVAFITKKGVTVPVGTVGFGEGVTRDLFREPVVKLLQQAAGKMRKDFAVAERMKKKGLAATSTFTPSHKRTHFLYDKGKIKRTVDGLVYVPRQYKSADKTPRNARQKEQDDERNAIHQAEWRALYEEALRQEKEEAAERAVWEKARASAQVALRPSDAPAITVEEGHIDAALEAGSFIYEPAATAGL